MEFPILVNRGCAMSQLQGPCLVPALKQCSTYNTYNPYRTYKPYMIDFFPSVLNFCVPLFF